MGIRVAVVGLGFGTAFAPIYRDHPDVDSVVLCDSEPNRLSEAKAILGIRESSSFETILSDPSIDAVHLLTPVFLHEEQTLACLAAGKHVACAVPMAMSVEGIGRVVDAARASGKRYMMMETAAYTREFFVAEALVASGRLGPITLARADYFQDLEAPYPDYWKRVPPMAYATHAIAPCLKLLGVRCAAVSCIGGGAARENLGVDYPYPLQIAQFRLEGSNAALSVTRAWYQAARQYVEGFAVYGEKMGFEWPQIEGEDPVVFELEPVQSEHRWRAANPTRVPAPFRPDLLPADLAVHADGGHGGSHAHLVHEFVRAVVEDRPSAIDEGVSADWSAPGLVAHQSSLSQGQWMEIPSWAPPTPMAKVPNA